ncbi:FliI/YscN family ATPase [Sandarakinorhabdus limnophila]|uniref:FliI/YscN family ATPase n=1 Tax=Sandarakinorhabdus limnophila TaxID=210512 RepID=UPI0026ED77E9|nr:FliI/YscN family ATPase [Sandarakinorhabdus limnophila]MCM0033773.1 FliI/YscN family ATPase [Sandarakinorhabdus limnophila]
MSVTASLARQIAAMAVPPLPIRKGGCVVAADGNITEAVGVAGAIGNRVALGAAGLAAEIIGFRDGRALLMGLSPLAGIAPGALVLPEAAGGDVAVGEGLLGRVIDGLGQPLDGLGPIMAAAHVPAAPPPLLPQARARVTQPLATGVRAIDALLTFGIGQRIGIMAGTGVGKSVLLGQITRWAQADVVVMALIGERSREISDFIDNELAGPARARTVTVAVPASDAMLCRVRGAQRAFAIAEWFRAQGRQVLLILDSLSRVVHGAREVAMARGEPSGSRGYPPSALQLIADVAERAGGDRRSGGSITLVATVLAESDDRADPVVDAARGVMDGHLLLSRRLAGRGQFPAIDLVSSASRVMIDVVSEAHNRAAQRFRRMVALIEENRDLVLMGAYAAGQDAELDLALALQPVLAAFMAQDRSQATDWHDNISTLLQLVPEA